MEQTKAFTRDEFSRVLFKCHNIIHNNDKLSPEAAFDEISKVLFIKIRYKREKAEEQIFSKGRFEENRKNYEALNKEMGIKDAIPFYQNLFEQCWVLCCFPPVLLQENYMIKSMHPYPSILAERWL